MPGPYVQAVQSVTSSAQVNLIAKIYASYAEVSEDATGAAVGLKITWPNGNVSEYTPAMQPVVLAGSKEHIGRGPLVGVPANYNGSNNAATVYAQVESMGADTKVRVSEWP